MTQGMQLSSEYCCCRVAVTTVVGKVMRWEGHFVYVDAGCWVHDGLQLGQHWSGDREDVYWKPLCPHLGLIIAEMESIGEQQS